MDLDMGLAIDSSIGLSHEAWQDEAALAVRTPRMWHVAYTKPRQEAIAQAHLERQGYDVYWPRLKVYTKKRLPDGHGQLPFEFEAMFPRYLFFRPQSGQQSISPVRSTVGISHVVRFGFEPAHIGEQTIERITQFEARQHLGSFEEIGPLQLGTNVRVTNGPFSGLMGLVTQVSSKRVLVLLELLGRENAVRLSPADVEPIS